MMRLIVPSNGPYTTLLPPSSRPNRPNMDETTVRPPTEDASSSSTNVSVVAIPLVALCIVLCGFAYKTFCKPLPDRDSLFPPPDDPSNSNSPQLHSSSRGRGDHQSSARKQQRKNRSNEVERNSNSFSPASQPRSRLPGKWIAKFPG